MLKTFPALDIKNQTIDQCIRLLEDASSLSPSFLNVHVAIGMIDGLCNAPMPANDADQFLDQIARDGRLSKLRHLLAEAEHCNERTQARTALNSDQSSEWLSPDTEYRYKKMIETELELLKSTNPNQSFERCAFVGCGALPLTAIFVSQVAGIPVVGIDVHSGCVKLGRQVLDNFFSDILVKLFTVAGENYDYANMDLVYVAAMVPNKQDVFRQISETNPKAVCITRGGAGLRQVFYEPVDIGALMTIDWRCTGVQPPIYPVRNTSYIFCQG